MLKNASFISLCRLLEKLCSFLVVIQLTYIFSPESMGQFFFYFSLVSLLIPLMDFGLKKLFVLKFKSRSNYENRETLATLLALKVICGLVTLGIAVSVDFLMNRGQLNFEAILFCFLAIFADEPGQFFKSPDHARENYATEILAPVINKSSCLLIIFLLKDQLESFTSALMIYALTSFLSIMISIYSLKGYFPKFSSQHFRSNAINLFKDGLPFSLTGLFVMISFFIDSVILGFFSMEENGIYNFAFRIIIVFGVLSVGFSQVIFARVSRIQTHRKNSISETLKNVLPIMMTLFISISIGVVSLGERPQLLSTVKNTKRPQAS